MLFPLKLTESSILNMALRVGSLYREEKTIAKTYLAQGLGFSQHSQTAVGDNKLPAIIASQGLQIGIRDPKNVYITRGGTYLATSSAFVRLYT